MADIIERLRESYAKDPATTEWNASVEFAAISAIATLRAELAEWHKLRDPVALHASLLRGLPAKLDRATYLHLAGDGALEQAAELATARARVVELEADGPMMQRGIDAEGDPWMGTMRECMEDARALVVLLEAELCSDAAQGDGNAPTPNQGEKV